MGPAGGVGTGRDLRRLDLDPGAFPEAVCSDGTQGFICFRPYEGEANRNLWVIQLQGGGGCGNAEACFHRWRYVDTKLGMRGMTDGSAARGSWAPFGPR